MKCICCNSSFTIRKGKRSGRQQYQCKSCGKYFLERYVIQRMDDYDKAYLIALHNWGSSLRAISYFTGFSAAGVVKALYRLSLQVKEPELKQGQSYQLDELQTFIAWKTRDTPEKRKRKKECWVAYSINESTAQVCGFVTGSRSKANIGRLTEKLLCHDAKRIHTDGLNIYPALIPKNIHRVFERCTNKIERHNLTMRTRIRRLSRKTLCFSRSVKMLEASLRIFFWGWTLVEPEHIPFTK
jgi:insertion element IS1 protein InsB